MCFSNQRSVQVFQSKSLHECLFIPTHNLWVKKWSKGHGPFFRRFLHGTAKPQNHWKKTSILCLNIENVFCYLWGRGVCVCRSSGSDYSVCRYGNVACWLSQHCNWTHFIMQSHPTITAWKNPPLTCRTIVLFHLINYFSLLPHINYIFVKYITHFTAFVYYTQDIVQIQVILLMIEWMVSFPGN